MNIQPSEARRLSYWEYSARLTIYNERHQTEDDAVELPSVEWMKHRDMVLADQGFVTGVRH